MKNIDIFKQNEKNFWISITGYRILLVLSALLQKDRSIDELIELLKKDEVTCKSVSRDTVRLTIKTLKSAGCEILRPAKSNEYKYSLISHPFSLNISDDELKYLSLLINRFSTEIKAQDVFVLNNVINKIISLTHNENSVNSIKNSAPLSKINYGIFKQISNPSIIGKKLSITYFSPKFNEEKLDIIPQRISYENGKLYLWCFTFKYNKYSLLDVERIIKINLISAFEKIDTVNSYEVVYKIFGDSVLDFKLDVNEEIIEKTKNYIVVKANVYQEFWFIQRMLLFGSDFKIISPDFFKQKLIDKIKKIKEWYKL